MARKRRASVLGKEPDMEHEPAYSLNHYWEAILEQFFLLGVLEFMLLLCAELSSVQFSRSVLSDSETPWTVAQQASLSIINSWSLLKLMSIALVMPSNHLILCHPLLLLPSIFPSIRVFTNESALHIRWPKYWSFSFNISPSNEYSGFLACRIDWLDLLAVQGTLKSLQHHGSKASVLRRSDQVWSILLSELISTCKGFQKVLCQC